MSATKHEGNDKDRTALIVEMAFQAGFKCCRERVERVLNDALSWTIPQKLNRQERRRHIVYRIMKEVERLNP